MSALLLRQGSDPIAGEGTSWHVSASSASATWRPTARNLIQAGHSLKVYDLSEEAGGFAIQSGAKRAASVKDAAKGVDFVVTMLPVGANVRECSWTTVFSPRRIEERC